jgi:hypothetical protein
VKIVQAAIMTDVRAGSPIPEFLNQLKRVAGRATFIANEGEDQDTRMIAAVKTILVDIWERALLKKSLGEGIENVESEGGEDLHRLEEILAEGDEADRLERLEYFSWERKCEIGWCIAEKPAREIEQVLNQAAPENVLDR